MNLRDVDNHLFATFVFVLLTFFAVLVMLGRANTIDNRQQRIEHKVDHITHVIEQRAR